MAVQLRGEGADAVGRRTHVEPFHSHVTESTNRTDTARALSYAIPWATAAGGAGTVEKADQALPSHSQVSLSALLPSYPPNKTVRARWESKSMPAHARGAGLCLASCAAQFCP